MIKGGGGQVNEPKIDGPAGAYIPSMSSNIRPARHASVPEEDSTKSSQKRTSNYLSQPRAERPAFLGGPESGHGSRLERSAAGDS